MNQSCLTEDQCKPIVYHCSSVSGSERVKLINVPCTLLVITWVTDVLLGLLRANDANFYVLRIYVIEISSLTETQIR